jgi:hypothetical protein
MHYVTCRSHQMQKCKFGVMCPIVLFLESVADANGVTCPVVFFVESIPVAPKDEK